MNDLLRKRYFGKQAPSCWVAPFGLCCCTLLLFSTTVENGYSQSHPPCVSAASDPDGDGYGWENNQSCLVTDSAVANRIEASEHPPCVSAASDPDGDGFGWENGKSCVAKAGGAAKAAPAAEPVVKPVVKQAAPATIAKRTIAQNKLGTARTDEITDVILITGQSNVAGSMTAFDASLDAPHQRVFAWTDKGWQIADLRQVWDSKGHPGNFSAGSSKRQPFNSFPFHFAKALTNIAPDRVPAIIVAAAPGKGISHWEQGGAFYRVVRGKVVSALQALPHKAQVDGILWHQGETDWQYRGTSDPSATGYPSSNSPEFVDYYRIKLDQLIRNFRAENWAGASTPFICGETRLAVGVNRHLMALNSDADPRTACVPATDLPARADDASGSHFSAPGLRELGARYADKFNEMR